MTGNRRRAAAPSPTHMTDDGEGAKGCIDDSEHGRNAKEDAVQVAMSLSHIRKAS